MNFEKEKIFQDAIFENENIKKDICACLNIKYNDSKFIREDTYINGITADFSLLENDIVKAIIECKGGKINVTDYVRGIGQIFQYEYFAEHKLSNKNYIFCDIDDFSSVYIFPDSVLRINDFNVGLFKYPKTKKIIEINEKNLAVRLISENELENLRESKRKNLKVLTQYYIRDNRLFELYFLLKVLAILKFKKIQINRKELEINILRKTNTINNKNWRNAFIALASLGFIDSQNYPTQMGLLFSDFEFEDFILMIFKSYISPYYEEILKVLKINSNLQNSDISQKIKENLKVKTDILFLSESSGRYISSWLNIARDDFGILNFTPRSNQRNIIYDPFVCNDETFKDYIRKNSAYFNARNSENEIYKEAFEGVLNEI